MDLKILIFLHIFILLLFSGIYYFLEESKDINPEVFVLNTVSTHFPFSTNGIESENTNIKMTVFLHNASVWCLNNVYLYSLL